MLNHKQFLRLITLNLVTSSHCTLAYIALSTALSYIFSNSILVFSFFTGLYLMSMGIGTLFVEKIKGDSDRFVSLIILNSLIGILLANPGIIGIMGLNEILRYLLRAQQKDLLFLLFPLGIVLTTLIGMVSGAELPFFSKLIEKEKWHVSKPIIGVLTSDYFGACVGILIFTFFLNPFLGLIPSILVSQILTLTLINITFFKLRLNKKHPSLRNLLILTNVYILAVLLLQEKLINLLDAISGF